MTSMVTMIKEIANAEVRKMHTLELGVVESVAIRESDDATENYWCSVILKGRKTDKDEYLKLENVQIATSHTGDVMIPYVNDLVLVGFINGDMAMPVILGRLYSKEKLAPLYAEGEHIMTPFSQSVRRAGARRAHVSIVISTGEI